MTKIGWWTSQPKVLILGDCDHAICAWQASSLDLLHDDQRGCFNDLTKRRLSMAAASDTFVTTSWKFQGTQNLQRKEPCKGLIFKPRKKNMILSMFVPKVSFKSADSLQVHVYNGSSDIFLKLQWLMPAAHGGNGSHDSLSTGWKTGGNFPHSSCRYIYQILRSPVPKNILGKG